MPTSVTDFPDERTSVAATIADGQSLSPAIDLGGCSPLCIISPASMEGTIFTFQVCPTVDGTFINLHKDDGTEYQVTTASSRATLLNPAHFAAFRFIKVRTGTSGAASAQSGGAAALTIMARPV